MPVRSRHRQARRRMTSGDERRDRARQEAAEPDRRPLQLPVSEQHQLQHRPAQGHAGHPQRPAGYSHPHQRGLERHHAHDPAADLAAVAAAGANRAVRHRPDDLLGVPLTEQPQQRLAMGRRTRHPDSHDQQQEPRLQCLGRRSDRRAGLHEGALGRRRAGQQCLVVRWHVRASAAHATTRS